MEALIHEFLFVLSIVAINSDIQCHITHVNLNINLITINFILNIYLCTYIVHVEI